MQDRISSNHSGLLFDTIIHCRQMIINHRDKVVGRTSIWTVPSAAIGPKAPNRQRACDLPNSSACCKHFPTPVASPTHLPAANIPHSRPQRQLSLRCQLAAAASAAPATVVHRPHSVATIPITLHPTPILCRVVAPSRAAWGLPCRAPVHLG
jgi:hypothetical protein